MESIERKDASIEPEEPIKTEEVVSNPDVTERNNSAPSPPPNCSICLGNLINTSFTDSCLHQFCFTCLLQWSKIKTECPLCKQGFKSIIHNVRSEEDYDQYHVQHTLQVAHVPPLGNFSNSLVSAMESNYVNLFPDRSFFYRTTMGASRRLDNILLERNRRIINPGPVARREQLPSIPNRIPFAERSRRRDHPLDFRRTVYRLGIHAQRLPDALGRHRECSAEYYRRNPTAVDRLIPWLNRELQALLNENQSHIAYVLNIITESLTHHDISSAAFRDRVRPFFTTHTEHFAHELENFASSNFDLVGYDQAVNYSTGAGLSNHYLDRVGSPSSSSSSSSNDSVRVVDNGETIDLTSLFPSRTNYISRRLLNSGSQTININMPGSSSTIDSFFNPVPMISHTLSRTSMEPDVLTISSDSSLSENECEVIGYVKPRHERTPEIIDLSSSEAEEIPPDQPEPPSFDSFSTIDESMPSTSTGSNMRMTCRSRHQVVEKAQGFDLWASTPESNSDETDSDYIPTPKSRYHKNSSKKISKSNSRKTQSISKKKKSSNTQRKRKERRVRSHSTSSDSDNENSKREVPTGRGKKRRLSKSSNDDSITKKPRKKSKKSKKSKSKKSKKRSAEKVNYSSNESISTDSEFYKKSNEEESNRSPCKSKRRKKSSEEIQENSPCHSARYSSDEVIDTLKQPSVSNEISLKNTDLLNSSESCNEMSQHSANAESNFLCNRMSPIISSRRSSVASDSSKNFTSPVTGEDEESHHTPPVSDEENRLES